MQSTRARAAARRDVQLNFAARRRRNILDTITPEKRSQLMGRIRSKNTKPEIAVRSLLHSLGYRFRLHRKDLPGRPDIVLPKHRKIILVQGCFWHGHNCKLASKPKSNQGYWKKKIISNQERDKRNIEALRVLGWDVLELWECDIRKPENLVQRVSFFMTSPL
ncbi:very short patch repair endonuclease [Burkholderia cepacia]|uniref:very short patch repair endonuclease n=1 Tax=Burkholderia cepacia TaxID=292 RepID=UPI002654B3FA|nr:very short patch repair endonuclease [Burkholderia cepacia]MDN7439375.1 very short patch repair endonuclease [Burkholderia cepacia]